MKRESQKEREQAECLERAVSYVLSVVKEIGVSEKTLCKALNIDPKTLHRLKKIDAVSPKNCWATSSKVCCTSSA